MKVQVNEVYNSAIKILVRREYSQYELRTKLQQSNFSEEEILNTLDRLIKENLQSDERFANMFVRTRISQGKGSVLIKQQLKQKGIAYFDFSEYDFYQLVKIVQQKKFKELPKNAKEKAQQIRFLQSRGFSFDEINNCF